MIVEFTTLPPNSKIWIHHAGKVLSHSEKEIIEEKTTAFLNEWSSHGNPLHASFQIKSNTFLIIGVNNDLSSASGCSIDSLVHLIKDLELALDLTLTDFSKVPYMNDDKIEFAPFLQLKNLIKEGKIEKSTIIFNNSITKQSELEIKWQIAAKDSWLSKHFNTTILSDN